MVTKLMTLSIILIAASCSFFQQSGVNQSDVKKELIVFLKSEKEIHDDNTDIYLLNLVGYEPFNGGKGLFKFGVLGSHHLEYIVIINDQDIEIITNYDTSSFMPRLNEWLQKYELSEKEKLSLVKNIGTLLERRYESIERNTIPEEIRY